MDIPAWIVSGDPKRGVVNCQGACKCNCKFHRKYTNKEQYETTDLDAEVVELV